MLKNAIHIFINILKCIMVLKLAEKYYITYPFGIGRLLLTIIYILYIKYCNINVAKPRAGQKAIVVQNMP